MKVVERIAEEFNTVRSDIANISTTPIPISSQLKGTYSLSNTYPKQLQLTDGLVSISNGYTSNGADNSLLVKSGTINPVGGWL